MTDDEKIAIRMKRGGPDAFDDAASEGPPRKHTDECPIDCWCSDPPPLSGDDSAPSTPDSGGSDLDALAKARKYYHTRSIQRGGDPWWHASAADDYIAALEARVLELDCCNRLRGAISEEDQVTLRDLKTRLNEVEAERDAVIAKLNGGVLREQAAKLDAAASEGPQESRGVEQSTATGTSAHGDVECSRSAGPSPAPSPSLDELRATHLLSAKAVWPHGCPSLSCGHKQNDVIECWYAEAQNSRALIAALEAEVAQYKKDRARADQAEQRAERAERERDYQKMRCADHIAGTEQMRQDFAKLRASGGQVLDDAELDRLNEVGMSDWDGFVPCAHRSYVRAILREAGRYATPTEDRETVLVHLLRNTGLSVPACETTADAVIALLQRGGPLPPKGEKS